METSTLLIALLWILVIGWGIWELIQFLKRRKAATIIENDEFKQNIRKAQVVDVREKDAFDSGHILGARNIPYMQMKQRFVELRKDQPIYLYDDSKSFALRAAVVLKKNDYENIYVLKGGYEDWDGRIKSK